MRYLRKLLSERFNPGYARSLQDVPVDALLEFANSYRKLGGMVIEQLRDIIREPEAQANPNAIEMIEQELGGANLELDEAIDAWKEIYYGEPDDTPFVGESREFPSMDTGVAYDGDWVKEYPEDEGKWPVEQEPVPDFLLAQFENDTGERAQDYMFEEGDEYWYAVNGAGESEYVWDENSDMWSFVDYV